MGIRRLGRPAGYNYPTGLNIVTVANTVVDYLVVAGGGGGGGSDYGSSGSGGGGAGGFRTASGFSISKETSYSITVGSGGPAGINPGPSPGLGTSGTKGSNSIFSTVHSEGGGFGRYGGPISVGGSGGSGGGGSQFPGSSGGTANTSTPQGSDGGSGTPALDCRGNGGGGGASATGGNGTSTNGGNGGNGTASSIGGSPVTYGGGGGGGVLYRGPGYTLGTTGTGGSGGGGNAGANAGGAGSNGTDNTGGGGGGASSPAGASAYSGGNGGKGIVIIRYSDALGNTAYSTGTLTTTPGYIIHTFTGDGTFTTNSNFGGSSTYSIN